MRQKIRNSFRLKPLTDSQLWKTSMMMWILTGLGDWETIRENIQISAKQSLGYYELKQHRPWFNKGCSEPSDHGKQGLQDLSQINGDILSNVKCEANRQFRNKRREYI
jgi:hypothetical protein